MLKGLSSRSCLWAALSPEELRFLHSLGLALQVLPYIFPARFFAPAVAHAARVACSKEFNRGDSKGLCGMQTPQPAAQIAWKPVGRDASARAPGSQVKGKELHWVKSGQFWEPLGGDDVTLDAPGQRLLGHPTGRTAPPSRCAPLGNCLVRDRVTEAWPPGVDVPMTGVHRGVAKGKTLSNKRCVSGYS